MNIDSLLAEVEAGVGPRVSPGAPVRIADAPAAVPKPAAKPPGRSAKCPFVTVTPPDDSMLRCPDMRCTKCDFDVVFRDNWAFTEGVDYQFTRFYYPDWTRLQEKMRRLAGP